MVKQPQSLPEMDPRAWNRVVDACCSKRWEDVYDYSMVGPGGMNLLHAVLYGRGDADSVRHLINNGTDVDAVCGVYRRSVLTIACGIGNRDIVESVLSKADVTKDRVALHVAASEGHDEIVDMLLKHGYDIDSMLDRLTPLMVCCLNSRYRMTEYLLDKGAKKSSKYNPTLLVSYIGNVKMMKLLVSNGVNINVKDCRYRTPIEIAIISGRGDMVDYLIGEGADVTNLKTSKIAAAFGNERILREVIRSGADMVGKCANGYDMFLTACHKGSYENMNILIENGCDVTTVNALGFSGLDLALFDSNECSRDKCLLLMKIGVEVGNVIHSRDTARKLQRIFYEVVSGNEEKKQRLSGEIAKHDVDTKRVIEALSQITRGEDRERFIPVGCQPLDVIRLIGKGVENVNTYKRAKTDDSRRTM